MMELPDQLITYGARNLECDIIKTVIIKTHIVIFITIRII